MIIPLACNHLLISNKTIHIGSLLFSDRSSILFCKIVPEGDSYKIVPERDLCKIVSEGDAYKIGCLQSLDWIGLDWTTGLSLKLRAYHCTITCDLFVPVSLETCNKLGCISYTL